MVINGEGKTSRDFCFIENAMQANLLATMAPESSRNEVYNVAVSDITSLNQLFGYLKSILKQIDIVFLPEACVWRFSAGRCSAFTSGNWQSRTKSRLCARIPDPARP